MNKQYVAFEFVHQEVLQGLTLFEKMACLTDRRLFNHILNKKNKSEAEEDWLEILDRISTYMCRDICSAGNKDDISWLANHHFAFRYIETSICMGCHHFASKCIETSICMGCDEPVIQALKQLASVYHEAMKYPAHNLDQSNRYDNQIFLFIYFYRNDLGDRLRKNAVLSENADLIKIFSTLYNSVMHKIVPWHHKLKRMDTINETNYAEPEDLIDLLKTINVSLLKILDSCGNKEQEYQSVRFLEEKITDLGTTMGKYNAMLPNNARAYES